MSKEAKLKAEQQEAKRQTAQAQIYAFEDTYRALRERYEPAIKSLIESLEGAEKEVKLTTSLAHVMPDYQQLHEDIQAFKKLPPYKYDDSFHAKIYSLEKKINSLIAQVKQLPADVRQRHGIKLPSIEKLLPATILGDIFYFLPQEERKKLPVVAKGFQNMVDDAKSDSFSSHIIDFSKKRKDEIRNCFFKYLSENANAHFLILQDHIWDLQEIIPPTMAGELSIAAAIDQVDKLINSKKLLTDESRLAQIAVNNLLEHEKKILAQGFTLAELFNWFYPLISRSDYHLIGGLGCEPRGHRPNNPTEYPYSVSKIFANQFPGLYLERINLQYGVATDDLPSEAEIDTLSWQDYLGLLFGSLPVTPKEWDDAIVKTVAQPPKVSDHILTMMTIKPYLLLAVWKAGGYASRPEKWREILNKPTLRVNGETAFMLIAASIFPLIPFLITTTGEYTHEDLTAFLTRQITITDYSNVTQNVTLLHHIMLSMDKSKVEVLLFIYRYGKFTPETWDKMIDACLNLAGPKEEKYEEKGTKPIIDARLVTTIGIYYYEKEGSRPFTKNFFKAAQLFSLAAEQGDKRAQCYLGLCYAKGEGVEKNLQRAIQLLKPIADSGKLCADVAAYELAILYEKEIGTDEALQEARHYYEYAANHGFGEARAALKKMDYEIRNCLFKYLSENENAHFLILQDHIRGLIAQEIIPLIIAGKLSIAAAIDQVDKLINSKKLLTDESRLAQIVVNNLLEHEKKILAQGFTLAELFNWFYPLISRSDYHLIGGLGCEPRGHRPNNPTKYPYSVSKIFANQFPDLLQSPGLYLKDINLQYGIATNDLPSEAEIDTLSWQDYLGLLFGSLPVTPEEWDDAIVKTVAQPPKVSDHILTMMTIKPYLLLEVWKAGDYASRPEKWREILNKPTLRVNGETAFMLIAASIFPLIPFLITTTGEYTHEDLTAFLTRQITITDYSNVTQNVTLLHHIMLSMDESKVEVLPFIYRYGKFTPETWDKMIDACLNLAGPKEEKYEEKGTKPIIDARLVTKIGIYYYEKEGSRPFTKNFFKAAQLFSLAAEQGDKRAQCYLGLCYAKGEGVEKNLQRAIQLLKPIADSGKLCAGLAAYELAILYEKEIGTDVALKEARHYYEYAAANHGFWEARDALKKMDKVSSSVPTIPHTTSTALLIGSRATGGSPIISSSSSSSSSERASTPVGSTTSRDETPIPTVAPPGFGSNNTST